MTAPAAWPTLGPGPGSTTLRADLQGGRPGGIAAVGLLRAGSRVGVRRLIKVRCAGG
jgi:hypothetical protein